VGAEGVAAEGHGLADALGLQQGFGVATTQPRMGLQHTRIAGQFLIETQQSCGVMQEWMEPAKTANQRDQTVDP